MRRISGLKALLGIAASPAQSRGRRQRGARCECEGLETRQLLSYGGGSPLGGGLQAGGGITPELAHDWHRYTAYLHMLQSHSHLTQAQYDQLVNVDIMALDHAIVPTAPGTTITESKSIAAAGQIQADFTKGWLTADGWSGEKATLALDLGGLRVPESVIDQTIADLTTVAQAVGVTQPQYQTLVQDFTQVENDIAQDPTAPSNYEPGNYYAANIRGFVHTQHTPRPHAQHTPAGGHHNPPPGGTHHAPPPHKSGY